MSRMRIQELLIEFLLYGLNGVKSIRGLMEEGRVVLKRTSAKERVKM